MSGKLEKMLIIAFDTAKDFSLSSVNRTFEVLINPENYTLDYKVKFSESDQGHGESGKQLKYQHTEPEELSFEFLFDNTGIIDDKATNSIMPDVLRLKHMLIGYNGNNHQPSHVILIWGVNIFKGRATEFSITYKLFKPDGTPIRAIAKVKFKSSIDDVLRALKENKTSPDLTHRRKIKAGDTLPLLCQSIYGDSKYYIEVAKINNLTNFRYLKPGTELVLPPLQKTSVVS